jgi:hypothetical protein
LVADPDPYPPGQHGFGSLDPDPHTVIQTISQRNKKERTPRKDFTTDLRQGQAVDWAAWRRREERSWPRSCSLLSARAATDLTARGEHMIVRLFSAAHRLAVKAGPSSLIPARHPRGGPLF